MNRAILAATLTNRPSPAGIELTGLPIEVDWLELRADLAGDLPAAWLRQRFRGRTIYALRSRFAGGLSESSDEQRTLRLIEAAKQFDFVELEADRDLTSAILCRIPPEQRIVLRHAPAADQRVLQRRFTELSATPARFYRLTCPAETLDQSLIPLLFLKSLGRSDVIAYATGSAGVWTSVMAPSLGSPVVFGTAGTDSDVNEGMSVACLIGDYGLPEWRTCRELYGIVGDPVSHSLSPRIHNAAYRITGRAAVFVPLLTNDFGRFWQSFVVDAPFTKLGIAARGFTVASPHKETASRTDGEKSEIVYAARSSNLVYRCNGKWRTETTDPDGVLLNLRANSISVADRNVAVVGCGGSGRAITAALHQAGAKVTMFNRNRERGRNAMQLLGVPFESLSTFRPEFFPVIVNATPVGRDGFSLPFDPANLRGDGVVIDLVYGTNATPLVEFARARGLKTIDGCDVLCTQAARQFQCMTGQPMPSGIAEQYSGLPRTHALASRNHRSATTVLDPPCVTEI